MNWSRCGMAAVLCATAAAQSIPEAQELDERGNAAMEQHRPDEGVRYSGSPWRCSARWAPEVKRASPAH